MDDDHDDNNDDAMKSEEDAPSSTSSSSTRHQQHGSDEMRSSSSRQRTVAGERISRQECGATAQSPQEVSPPGAVRMWPRPRKGKGLVRMLSECTHGNKGAIAKERKGDMKGAFTRRGGSAAGAPPQRRPIRGGTSARQRKASTPSRNNKRGLRSTFATELRRYLRTKKRRLARRKRRLHGPPDPRARRRRNPPDLVDTNWNTAKRGGSERLTRKA